MKLINSKIILIFDIMDIQDEKKVLSIQQKLGKVKREIEELENKFSVCVTKRRNEETQNARFIHCGTFTSELNDYTDVYKTIFNVFVPTDDDLTIPFCIFTETDDRNFKQPICLLLEDVGYYYFNGDYVFGELVVPQVAMFLKSKSEAFKELTNYEVIVNAWNHLRPIENQVLLPLDENKMPIIPDYNLLTTAGIISSCKKFPTFNKGFIN